MNFLKSYRNVSCIFKRKFKWNFLCVANLSDSIEPNSINNLSHDDMKEDILNSIFNGIVLETKEFLLVDKPAGVSLFRSKPSDHLAFNGLSSTFTVDDILLELSAKLKLANSDSLFISSELPWAFSGLFVISKTKDHAEICKTFYKNSSMGKILGYINQSYRCLCWNLPKQQHCSIKPFTYSFYQPNETDYQYVISYATGRPSKKDLIKRKFFTKHIGHDVVSVGNRENDSVFLIDVKCNSTYRGLIPLYLLHQGTIVIGEFIQASRLISGGANNDVCILPPEKTNPAKPLPIQLKQRLGPFSRQIKQLPLHIHCNQLLVPSTKNTRKTKSYLTENGVFNWNTTSPALINWDSELKLNVCSYDKLPNHYIDVMNQLGIIPPFDKL